MTKVSLVVPSKSFSAPAIKFFANFFVYPPANLLSCMPFHAPLCQSHVRPRIALWGSLLSIGPHILRHVQLRNCSLMPSEFVSYKVVFRSFSFV